MREHLQIVEVPLLTETSAVFRHVYDLVHLLLADLYVSSRSRKPPANVARTRLKARLDLLALAPRKPPESRQNRAETGLTARSGALARQMLVALAPCGVLQTKILPEVSSPGSTTMVN